MAVLPYREARDEAMNIRARNNPDDAARLDEIIGTKMLPGARRYSEAIMKYRGLIESQASEATDQAHATYIHGCQILGGCSAVALLLSILIGGSVTRSITVPTRGMVSAARQMAAGDLSSTAATRVGRDELGELVGELNTMRMSWSKIVESIRSSSGAISTATREIAAGNTDLSARTEEQAASLEETAASMEQIAATVKQNTENARQANQLAANASEIAMRGGAVVGEVVETMTAISTSSQKISEIVSVIDGIAFQTNILALNAAVEAARAGEQGKGFAVVAGEVRALAQRSATAAKEIKDLIENSASKVNAGSEQVGRAGTTMQEIVSAVRHVTDIMGEISAASQEQSSGIDQVNNAVSQMDQVTQQNAALVEQAAAAANALQDQATELVRAVSVFKISDERTIDVTATLVSAQAGRHSLAGA